MSHITLGLNFNTDQYHVIGGCDMYTTKPIQEDKRLYRELSAQITSECEAAKQRNKRYSDPEATREHELALDTAFGSLDEPESRRKFTYLIGALNSSHDDYEFSDVLTPHDFQREASAMAVHWKIDDLLFWVRPCPASALELVPSPTGQGYSLSLPDGRFIWCPKMWDEMEDQMDLSNCEIYSCKALEKIFTRDDQSIWCLHFLFYNPVKKRVLYFYCRIMGLLSHSPPWFAAKYARKMGVKPDVDEDDDEETGAAKRADYWFGYDDEEMDQTNDEGYWDETFNDETMWEMSDSESDNDEIEKIRRRREKGEIFTPKRFLF